jgi:hypothetical protein
MNFVIPFMRTQLAPRNDANTELCTGLTCGVDAIHRVVISERNRA